MFQKHIQSLKDIIPVPDTEIGLSRHVTLDQIAQMFREDKLLEVHETLSRVSLENGIQSSWD